MNRKLITAALVLFTVFGVVLFALPASASAQGTSLIPQFIQDIFNSAGNNPADYITARVRLGIIIGLMGVILVSVVYSILASIKYASSQGDEGKVAEAKKSIQAILSGIAALFIAIVGIILVLVFFRVSTPVTQVYNFCITAPDSDACQSCTNGSTANTQGCTTACEAQDAVDGLGAVGACGTF